MRTPPPVEFVSGLGRAWAVVLGLSVAAAVVSPVAWALPFAGVVDPIAIAEIALGAGLLAGLAFWIVQGRTGDESRLLRWNGRIWTLARHSAGRPRIETEGHVRLMMDLGPWMLAHFQSPVGPGVWLPLTWSDGTPANWTALRDALWNWRHAQGPRP